MVKPHFVYFSAFLLLLAACNRRKHKRSQSSQITGIHLRKDLSVPIDSLSGRIGQRINNVAVDRKGNIYLADQSQAKIDIVSPEGNYLGSIGKRGRGPGDFNHLKGVAIYTDTLYVLENNPDRFSAFRLDNRHLIRMKPFPIILVKKHRLGAPKLIYPRADGTYEVVFPNYTMARFGTPYNYVTFSMLKHNLEPADTVVRRLPPSRYFLYTNPKNGGKVNFARFGKGLVPKTLVAFDGQGHLYEARSDSMNIQVFNAAGQKIRDLSHHYSPPAFTQGDLDSIVSKLQATRWKKDFRAAIKQNHVQKAGHWMAMRNLLVDNKDRCWVELVNPRRNKQTWWVFNTKGKLKWQCKLPKQVHLYVVRNQEAYGILKRQGKYPIIVRYHIKGI
ncbi:MAG TPA: 6-bladed beta-propeller [Balneolaceae bacterium]|nr:6-bladed beta-propeller [Balneolaceae bacterium]